MTNRRDFLKDGTLLAASAAFAPSLAASQARAPRPAKAPGARMKLTYKPYTLSLKHVFTIATSSREPPSAVEIC